MTTYNIGGGWGCHIEWLDAGKKVAGHHTPRPKKGDLLRAPMVSGKTGVFYFKKVEYCLDPHDMFFADVEFSYYEGGAPKGEQQCS